MAPSAAADVKNIVTAVRAAAPGAPIHLNLGATGLLAETLSFPMGDSQFNEWIKYRRDAVAALTGKPVNATEKFIGSTSRNDRISQLRGVSGLVFEDFIKKKLSEPFVSRSELFEEMDRFLTIERSPRVLIIKGDPGTGKSTAVAKLLQLHAITGGCIGTGLPSADYSIASLLVELDGVTTLGSDSQAPVTGVCNHRLIIAQYAIDTSRRVSDRIAAFHICEARNSETLSSIKFVRSIAAQLTQSVPKFMDELFAPNSNCLTALESEHAETALVHGVLRPLAKCIDRRLCIVIDSLDESIADACDRMTSIAELIASRSVVDATPLQLQFVVTSRFDPRAISKFNSESIAAYEFDTNQAGSDAEQYIKRVLFAHGADLYRWVERVHTLSNGNFLVAHELLKRVKSSELDTAVSGMLENTNIRVSLSVSDLFSQLLKARVVNWHEVRPIFEVVLASQSAIHLDDLFMATFLISRCHRDDFRNRLTSIQQFLHVSTNQSYSIYHKSFADWLLDVSSAPKGSTSNGSNTVDLNKGHTAIAAAELWNRACRSGCTGADKMKILKAVSPGALPPENAGSSSRCRGDFSGWNLSPLLFHAAQSGVAMDHWASAIELIPDQEPIEILVDANNPGCDDRAKIVGDLLKRPKLSLVTVKMIGQQLGDSGAQQLADGVACSKTLRSLDLQQNFIGDRGANYIASALRAGSSVTELYLYGNRIGDAGAIAIADALKVISTLRGLYLANNHITSSGYAAFASRLQANMSVIELSGIVHSEIPILLGRNRALVNQSRSFWSRFSKLCKPPKPEPMMDTSIADLSRTQIDLATLEPILKARPRVRSLLLINNSIESTEVESIIKALKAVHVITRLDLDCNNIGILGAVSIAKFIQSDTTLTELSLQSNNIGFAGARAIAESLPLNHSLQSLWLKDNNIGSGGAEALAAGLEKNTTLKVLGLSENSIDTNAADCLLKMLAVNVVLTEIYLYHNPCGADAEEILKRLRRHRRPTNCELFFDSKLDQNALSSPAKVDSVAVRSIYRGWISYLLCVALILIAFYVLTDQSSAPDDGGLNDLLPINAEKWINNSGDNREWMCGGG